MIRGILHTGQIPALLCIGLLVSGTVSADKPASAGGGHKNRTEHDGGSARHSSHSAGNRGHSSDDDRKQSSSATSSDSKSSDDRNCNNGRGHENDRDHDDARRRFDKNNGGERKGHGRDSMYRRRYFDEHGTNKVHDHYAQLIRNGRCPRGLYKTRRGCSPPGHARRWEIGHQLPRNVVFYDVEPDVLIYFGPPPPRHRYVRVASDILLITLGTAMVLDAIDDLGRY